MAPPNRARSHPTPELLKDEDGFGESESDSSTGFVDPERKDAEVGQFLPQARVESAALCKPSEFFVGKPLGQEGADAFRECALVFAYLEVQ
jgi:hypothetical protein